MIICICNRYTADDFACQAKNGCRDVETAFQRLGCPVQCGQCLCYAEQILASHTAVPAAKNSNGDTTPQTL